MKILKLMKMMKNRPLIDVWHYLMGNYRYFFYYGGKLSKKFALIAWLRKRVIRKHIKEQIDFRIKVMDRDCYNNGECKICGCSTTALQMTSKSCDKPCYPPMMSKKKWHRFKNYQPFEEGKSRTRVWMINRITNLPDLFIWDDKNNNYTKTEYHVSIN